MKYNFALVTSPNRFCFTIRGAWIDAADSLPDIRRAVVDVKMKNGLPKTDEEISVTLYGSDGKTEILTLYNPSQPRDSID